MQRVDVAFWDVRADISKNVTAIDSVGNENVSAEAFILTRVYSLGRASYCKAPQGEGLSRIYALKRRFPVII